MACRARKIEVNRRRCAELWGRLYPGVKMPQTYLARWYGETRASCGWLLDMGSGGGGSLDFRAGPGPGASVGLDVDFESLKRNGNVLYHVVGSVDAMPFRDGVFDAVTAQYVLEHVEKPVECFGEISRVSAPGARFLFMTTNAASYAGILIKLTPKKIQAMVKRRFLKMEEREIYPVYMRCNSKGALARLLRRAGFGRPEWVFVGGPFYFSFSCALFRVAVMLERLTDGRLKHLKFYMIGRSRKSGPPPGSGAMQRGPGGNKRIFFLYHKDYSKELEDWRAGLVPGTRLFGLGGFMDGGPNGWTGLHLKVGAPWLFNLLHKRRLFRMYQALWAAVNARSYDVIVAAHESNSYWVLALKKLGLIRRPVVILSVALLKGDLLSGIRHRIVRWLLSGAGRGAVRIVSYSSFQPAMIADRFGIDPRRLEFMPLSVDGGFFAPGSVPREDFILSAGTNPGKDFETLIKAAGSLPYRTLIITDADNMAGIRQFGALPSNVTVEPGGRPIAELRELYARCRIFVMPLLDVAFSTGQTVVLENMAMGRPVIATGVGCITDYVQDGETGLLVRPKDAIQLRDKIRFLWENADEAERLGRSAAKAVREKFPLDAYTAKLLQIVESVVKSDGNGGWCRK